MFVDEMSNLLNASASSADDGYAEYAININFIRYEKLWKSFGSYTTSNLFPISMCVFFMI